MSFPLWTPVRDIPLLPFFTFSVTWSDYLSWAVLMTFFTSILVYQITLNKISLRLFLGSLLVLLIQDQLRWQPWIYMYILMLLPFGFINKNNPEKIKNYLQLILIAVYFWGGIHKMHPNFITSTFSSIFGTYFYFLDESTLKGYLFVGYLLPVTEIAIAVFLIIPKLRSTGVQLAIISHIFIMAYLGPWGIDFNRIVLPWNLAMVILVFTLFADKKRISIVGFNSVKKHWFYHGAFILLYLLPILNAFGKWDHYLSFSLYSNKAPHFYVASEYNSFGTFTASTETFIKKMQPLSGNGYLDINTWCMSSLKVPFYPEERVFKQFAKHFCNTDPNPDKLLFITKQPTWNDEIITSFYCKD